MENIILLSSGFSNPTILAKVQEAVHERKYRRAVIITTAHPKKEKSPWASVTKDQLGGSWVDRFLC